MSKLPWFCILLFLILSALACNVGRKTAIPEKLEWPLASIEETGPGVFDDETERGLFIDAAPGVSLSKLVDLSVFGDFRPAMSEHAGSRFYELESARIEVADEPYSSDGVTCHRRTLYAYPKTSSRGCSLNAVQLFHASINAHIPKKDSIEVCVAEPGDGERVWVLIRDGCVESLNWATSASMGYCSDDVPKI